MIDPKKEFTNCLEIASIYHREQRRKDPEKTPYINHPIGVAYIISAEAQVNDLDIICAALLHDIIEDTTFTTENLMTEFGAKVSNIVLECTDDKSLPKPVRKQLQIEKASNSSPEAKLVKLADKLYNLRDLERVLPEGWTEGRRKEYFQWAFKVCEGLRGVSPELEIKLDEIFKNQGLVTTLPITKKRYEGSPSPWRNIDSVRTLLAAVHYAAVQHCHQNLSDGLQTPFINHVISIARILSFDANINEVYVLCATYLHDTVEYTNTTLQVIEKMFSGKTASLVADLTMDKSVPIADQRRIQIENVSKMSHEAQIITLVHKLYNCQKLEKHLPDGWTEDMRKEYFEFAFKVCEKIKTTSQSIQAQLECIWKIKGFV